MVTIIRKNSKTRTYKTISEEKLVTMMSSGEMAVMAKDYREEYVLRRALNAQNTVDESIGSSHIPNVCFAAEWKKSQRKLTIKKFNGLVLLQVNNLRSAEDAVELRKEASRHPYTYMAFVGLSGYFVMIVCRLSIEQDYELYNEEQLAKIQHNAYQRLHYIYSAQLGLTIDNLPPALDATCSLSYDPDAYFNPHSEPYFVRGDEDTVPRYRGQNDAGDNARQFDISNVATLGLIFECCLSDAVEKARTECSDPARLSDAILTRLADYCCESGLPQDYALMRARWKGRFREINTEEMTLVFSNAYEEMESVGIPYKHLDRQALMAYKSEAFLNMHYELRRNVISGVVQYRRKDGFDYEFHDLTEQVMNTMTHTAIKHGIGSWDKDMRRIVNSNIVPQYDPIADYLYQLPKWDGKDRVGELVRRIPSDCLDLEMYLHTWLLSMVAHWLGKDSLHGNALVPILIGGQGCGKTSFCSIILPPELRDYYNDKVEFKNETSLVLGLSSFALINIDEFDALKKSQQPTLKYLLSKNDVKLRMPYGKSFEQRRRYASFVGTTNNLHPLVDRTGSRRFLCIKVLDGKRIDFLTPIDYQQLYSQLRTEVFQGKRYWLDEEQTATLMAHNRQFMRMQSLPQMLDKLFDHPQTKEEAEIITTYQVVELLNAHFPEFNQTQGTANEIGKYFSSRGFECGKRNKGAIYTVKYRTVD